jgi:hypothetical protein
MNGHVIKPNTEIWAQYATNERQRNSKFSFLVSLSLERNVISRAASVCRSMLKYEYHYYIAFTDIQSNDEAGRYQRNHN